MGKERGAEIDLKFLNLFILSIKPKLFVYFNIKTNDAKEVD